MEDLALWDCTPLLHFAPYLLKIIFIYFPTIVKEKLRGSLLDSYTVKFKDLEKDNIHNRQCSLSVDPIRTSLPNQCNFSSFYTVSQSSPSSGLGGIPTLYTHQPRKPGSPDEINPNAHAHHLPAFNRDYCNDDLMVPSPTYLSWESFLPPPLPWSIWDRSVRIPIAILILTSSTHHSFHQSKVR